MTARLSPEQRKAQIVQAARGVLIHRGLAATSLRDIAAAAEVSLGTVTYHFSGIDEILSAVVISESGRFYAQIVEVADATEDPWAALDILMDPLFADSEDAAAHWRIWTDYWSVVSRRPQVAQAYAGRIRFWEDCAHRVIARGVASGHFRELDAAAAALQLAAYSDGLGMQLAQQASGINAITALEWMRQFSRMLLG